MAKWKCKHENADHLKPGEVYAPYGRMLGFTRVTVEQFRCIDCGAWLSLGPANDRPPHVQHEIALASALADAHCTWRPSDMDEWVEGFIICGHVITPRR